MNEMNDIVLAADHDGDLYLVELPFARVSAGDFVEFQIGTSTYFAKVVGRFSTPDEEERKALGYMLNDHFYQGVRVFSQSWERDF